MLWCCTYNVTVTSKPTSKAVSSATLEPQKIAVDDIYQQLRDKHKDGKYDEERLRMWAHHIHMGKHTSLEEPPDKPYFRGRKIPSSESNNSGCSKMFVVSNSPGRKVTLRTELIDQLEKWNRLHTAGVIDEDEYQELRKSILADIKGLGNN